MGEIASQTPEPVWLRLRAMVDQAANYALAENRKIEVQDLCRAQEARGPTAAGAGMERFSHSGADPARSSVHHPFARRSCAHPLSGT